MRRILLLLSVAFLFLGCERIIPMESVKCDHTTRDQRAQFTLSCIKNANPHADEDPESWLEICEDMATRLYCNTIKGFRVWGNNPSSFISCQHAKTPEEQKVCRS